MVPDFWKWSVNQSDYHDHRRGQEIKATKKLLDTRECGGWVTSCLIFTRDSGISRLWKCIFHGNAKVNYLLVEDNQVSMTPIDTVPSKIVNLDSLVKVHQKAVFCYQIQLQTKLREYNSIIWHNITFLANRSCLCEETLLFII